MPKSILIVDDSSAVRQSISFILEQSGYSCMQAVDGADGLNKTNIQQFDLIISDVNMPNMDGISLTKNIRQSINHKFTPILILTTESQSDKMQEGKAAGATGWIVKPFDQEKLLTVVKKLIG